MSVLELMRHNERNRLISAHPMQGEDISVRFPYIVGAFMVSSVDGELTTDNENFLAELVLAFGLLEEQVSQVMSITAENETRNDIIFAIVEALNSKEQQYAFILDLYNSGCRDGKISPQTQKLIDLFADMLKISPAEQKFLWNFAKTIINGDVAYARRTLSFCRGFEIPVTMPKQLLTVMEYQLKK